MGKRAIVTGSRHGQWTLDDVLWVCDAAIALHITRFLHGAAPGYDQVVGDMDNRVFLFANIPGLQDIVPYPVTPQDWRQYGKRAGPRRNGRMADACQPGDYCLAFPGQHGTNDMKRQAAARSLIVIQAHTRPWEK